MPPRILVTGPTGQVGWELCRTLSPLGEVVALGRATRPVLDLADPKGIAATVREVRPDLIVNAAAYTAVDKAEEERTLAMTVNGESPGVLAEEAKRLGIPLIHYSTDYVFDGSKGTPYTEEDEPAPINVYGESKLAGERAVEAVGGACLVLRTSWVYGVRGKNFLLTMRRLAREREVLKVVEDQRGSPTWSLVIAEATALIVARTGLRGLADHAGLYHLAAAGETSWHGFATAIVENERLVGGCAVRRVEPIPTSAFPTPARRPLYSLLDCGRLERTFDVHMPRWERSLALCLDDLCWSA